MMMDLGSDPVPIRPRFSPSFSSSGVTQAMSPRRHNDGRSDGFASITPRDSPNYRSTGMNNILTPHEHTNSIPPGVTSDFGASSNMRSLLTSADVFEKLANAGHKVAPEFKNFRPKKIEEVKKRNADFGKKVFQQRKEAEYHSSYLRTNIYPAEFVSPARGKRAPLTQTMDRIITENGFWTIRGGNEVDRTNTLAQKRSKSEHPNSYDRDEFFQDEGIFPLRDDFATLGRLRRHDMSRLLGASPENPLTREEFELGTNNFAKKGLLGQKTAETTESFELGHAKFDRKNRGECNPAVDDPDGEREAEQTAANLNIQPLIFDEEAPEHVPLAKTSPFREPLRQTFMHIYNEKSEKALLAVHAEQRVNTSGLLQREQNNSSPGKHNIKVDPALEVPLEDTLDAKHKHPAVVDAAGISTMVSVQPETRLGETLTPSKTSKTAKKGKLGRRTAKAKTATKTTTVPSSVKATAPVSVPATPAAASISPVSISSVPLSVARSQSGSQVAGSQAGSESANKLNFFQGSGMNPVLAHTGMVSPAGAPFVASPTSTNAYLSKLLSPAMSFGNMRPAPEFATIRSTGTNGPVIPAHNATAFSPLRPGVPLATMGPAAITDVSSQSSHFHLVGQSMGGANMTANLLAMHGSETSSQVASSPQHRHRVEFANSASSKK